MVAAILATTVAKQGLAPQAAAAAVALLPRMAGWQAAEIVPVGSRDAGQTFDFAAGTPLGAVELKAVWIDFRGQPIPPGRYALRYTLQPRLKEHAGRDAIRDFALLVPETTVGPGENTARNWIAESRRVSGTGHPTVMALVSERSAADTAMMTVRSEWVVDRKVGFVVAGTAVPAEAF